MNGRSWYDDTHMQQQSPSSRKNNRLGAIERQILELIALEAASYEHILSQTSLYAYGYARFPRKLAAYRYRIRQAIQRLQEQKYIRRSGNTVTITHTGEQKLRSAALRNKDRLGQPNWDGKWRIAAFDIPEEFSTMRNQVRRILKEAGFIKLQNSVWIFPHECEELVQLIKEESRLRNHILYGVLEHIENELMLKKHFQLQ
jgi:hypothetical protein